MRSHLRAMADIDPSLEATRLARHSRFRRTAGKLKPPIILIGFHRSGTTIIQDLIGLHPDVVSWFEPRTLWLYADPARKHDEFDESDATDRVVKYIRGRFLKYQARHGGRRILEKTPSNVLRVPYVNAIFPEATFLYVTRNPFSCISSADLKWHNAKTWTGLQRTLSATPVTQLHHYAKDFIDHMILARLLRRKPNLLFGPRYDGMDLDLKRHKKLKVIARQWALSSRKAREDLAKLGSGRTLAFRYEDLIEAPRKVLQHVFDHCELTFDEKVIRKAEKILDPGRQEKWLRLDQNELKDVVPILRDEMEIYGYEAPPTLR